MACIHHGRVCLDRKPSLYLLTGAGLLKTEYEHSNFIVYDTLDNGWLQIRLKPGRNGEAWTHQCHLGIGKAKLTYKKWQFFLKEHGAWLHFRSWVPHSLREQPDRTCSSGPERELKGSIHEGWVKWRDEKKGP